MKKVISLIVGLMMLLTSVCACAETEETVFSSLAGMEWTFSSGAGGWSTDMQIMADGTFQGQFHDSEMGDTADSYPDGTLYLCAFSGRMAVEEQVSEHAWKIRVEELQLDEEAGRESISEGVRTVTAEPYGISAGDEMLLYAPGTPMDTIPEDMRFWTHALDMENPPAELENWFLTSEKNESGFVGMILNMINPWETVTAEELKEFSGFVFGVPEGAENIVYRLLRDQGLAEMQFTMGEDDYCARMQAVELQEGEWMNISGMYFAWENEEEVQIGQCRGTIGQAQADASDWVELCTWYDSTSEIVYCLSVGTTDLDGLDLTAVAEQVYIPMD